MYHSQDGQDRFVRDLLRKTHGIFVEFGALDGLLHSNSLFFEQECGWTGLLIEANPVAFDALVRNRPDAATVNAAVYDRDGVAEFEQIDGGLYGWSGIRREIDPQHRQRIEAMIPAQAKRTIEVPCMTLDRALIQHGIKHIDYLSMDTEGSELAILKVFPFEKYEIEIIGVEDNFDNRELDGLIKSKGFTFLAKIGYDRFYSAGSSRRSVSSHSSPNASSS